MQRLNRTLYFTYVALCVAVFVLALVWPPFRAMSYAPLRELLMPPPPPIIVNLLYSTEKEDWLAEVIPAFEGGRYTVDGRPIRLALHKMGSREMYLAVLNGNKKPDLISPAGSLQISLLRDLSARKPTFARPVVRDVDCRSVVNTPLVLVAWRDRAEALFTGGDTSRLWQQLHDAVVNPAGWKAFGEQYAGWGLVDFAHTDPLASNSGFMTILAMTYSFFDKTTGLSAADILDPDYQAWFLEFENSIADFGSSTGTFMKEMIAYGPSKYELVTVYESTAIEQAANAVGRYGELRVYYPPATVMSDHPFCVLDADWVTPEKKRAARMFMDYLLSPPAQALALRHGFRPVDPTLGLTGSDSPFVRFANLGLQVELPPDQIEVPPGDVLDTLLNLWQRGTQR
jgi:ABC-type Fe3+ transport system substrate-binding protein